MPARNGDRGLFGGDRALIDRGLGSRRRGDRWLPDRWSVGESPQPPTTPHLLNGLVSYWKLDEAHNGVTPVTRVDSFGTNHLTDPTVCLAFPGKINNGCYFNGSGNWLLCNDNASLRVNGDHFFSLWARLDVNDQARVFVAKFDGATSQYGIQHDPVLGFQGGGAQVGSPAAVGVLHHVVYWYEASSLKGYLRINDANTYVSAPGSGLPAPNTAPISLGALWATVGGYNWNGLLDECGFWKGRIPTSTEITALFNGGSGLPFSSFTA